VQSCHISGIVLTVTTFQPQFSELSALNPVIYLTLRWKIAYNREVDYFTSTPIATLIKHAKQRHYPKGQIILYEGEVPSDLYIIKEGVVKIYDIDDQGNEKIVHLLKTPAMFPMVFFVGDKDDRTHFFYTTVTDAEVYIVPKDIVEQEMLNDAKLAIHLMHTFSLEIHEMLVRLSSLERTTTYDKLIAALKFLSVHHAEERKSGWRRVHFPISHQVLADMIGVTRESTTMVMKDLQDQKVIRNPRLTILEINFKKLIEL